MFIPLFPPVQYINTPMSHVNKVIRELQPDIPSSYDTYSMIMECLESLKDTPNTFNAVRSDINLLTNYAWFVLGIDIIQLKVSHMMQFIEFCNNPPETHIAKASLSIAIASKSDESHVELNADWRPFVNRHLPQPYKRTKGSLKAQLSNLSYVYVFFEDMEYSFSNPAAVAMRRLTSGVERQLRVSRAEHDDKGLSSLQFFTLLDTVDKLAENDPSRHERTRFLIHLLLFAYPRLSECSARPGYSPVMSDFRANRDKNGNQYVTFWIPFSKGGKSRNVTVNSLLVESLERYRLFLGLSRFPEPGELTPMFVRHKASSHGREARVLDANLGSERIAEIVTEVFEQVALNLESQGLMLDAADMRTQTTHSLRHTGIQLDISAGRELSDIMLDAGHSSVATLAIYTSRRTEYRAASVNLKNRLIQHRDDE